MISNPQIHIHQHPLIRITIQLKDQEVLPYPVQLPQDYAIVFLYDRGPEELALPHGPRPQQILLMSSEIKKEIKILSLYFLASIFQSLYYFCMGKVQI